MVADSLEVMVSPPAGSTWIEANVTLAVCVEACNSFSGKSKRNVRMMVSRLAVGRPEG